MINDEFSLIWISLQPVGCGCKAHFISMKPMGCSIHDCYFINLHEEPRVQDCYFINLHEALRHVRKIKRDNECIVCIVHVMDQPADPMIIS